MATKWVEEFRDSLGGGIARPREWQIIDVHRYVTAKFETADAADKYARHAKTAKPTYKYDAAGGDDEIDIIRRKRLPANIERRGNALHTAYELLNGELTSGEELRQHHEKGKAESTKEFFARHVPLTSSGRLPPRGGTTTARRSSCSGRNPTSA